jgi:thiamine-monophosphate kinase
MDETARIAMIARILAAKAEGVELGIGDDAAVLVSPPAGARIVWTIDQQVEGAHFRRELASWHDVGWRSYCAAASDVAAMGAKPWCALCALVLPDDVDAAALEGLTHGQGDAASDVGAPIVGGNLSRGSVLSVATTLLGVCERPVARAGARPGDGVWLAGQVGMAAAGLRALASGRGGDKALRAAVAAWRTPRALVSYGLAMAKAAHAAIDVSDGLARDVGHIAKASGVEIVLDASELRRDAGLVEASAALGADALDLALYGGEDYALVAASDLPIQGFRRIGEIRSGTGLVLRDAGHESPLEARGFDHFAKSTRDELP